MFGVPMFPSLDQVPEPIDIVDVSRRPEHALEVARQAVAADLDLVVVTTSDAARQRGDARQLVGEAIVPAATG